jgi:hypothetical protein
MEDPKKELHDIHFIHCALPDMALSEADTSYHVCGIDAKAPIAVLLNDKRSAAQKSSEMPGIIFVVESEGSSIAFKDGNEVSESSRNAFRTVKVGDGVGAAKALRAFENAIPCINETDAGRIDTYIKQLKIAMFLTNSRSIDDLKNAPIYKTNGI